MLNQNLELFQVSALHCFKYFIIQESLPTYLDEYDADKKRLCNMTHSEMLGKVESGGGPIFKVVLEC